MPSPGGFASSRRTPTARARRRGHARRPTGTTCGPYQPPLDETRPLEEHILALWEAVRQHVDYVKSLKETLNVDVFCGYRSNSQTAGFQVGHGCLELFVKLEVPFGVSEIVQAD
jgi:hypothetical protein